MSDDDTPTLFQAITGAIERRMLASFGPMPGKITAYNATYQRASVQPLLMRTNTDEFGARVPERLPTIDNVPIVFPGAGSYRMTFPISVGDTVLLVFADSSIDKWIRFGGEVDPNDDRHGDLSDAIAIPGMFNFNNCPTTAPTDAMVLHGDVKIGSPSASSAVALKSDLDMLRAALDTAVISIGAAGAATVGVAMDAAAAAITPLATWPVCATKAKAL